MAKADPEDYTVRPITPHPLVQGLDLAPQPDRELQKAADELPPPYDRFKGLPVIPDDIGSAIGHRERTRLEGYLAGRIRARSNKGGKAEESWWLLLYLDDACNSYALVPCEEVVDWVRQYDRTAAYRRRDLVWVQADARILQGDCSQSLTGRFTVGNFTRARDFRASFRGGTQDSLSELGPLCTANTPCCCGGKSR
jgi:hypothetical protein